MQQCWQEDPGARPTFDKIVNGLEDSLLDMTLSMSEQVSPASHLAGSKVYFVWYMYVRREIGDLYLNGHYVGIVWYVQINYSKFAA